MSRCITDSTLALSGIFQVATLVQHIATRGIAEDPYFTASINSIFHLDAPDVNSIFGDTNQLKLGLHNLLTIFDKKPTINQQEQLDVTRYVISLMHLERKFTKQKKMIVLLREKICDVKRKADYFSTTHENIIAALAETYQATLSQLSYRIHVSGQSDYLRQAHYFQRIRALLLAGVRASVLWRQCGGSRLQLFSKRTLIISTAEKLYNE